MPSLKKNAKPSKIARVAKYLKTKVSFPRSHCFVFSLSHTLCCFASSYEEQVLNVLFWIFFFSPLPRWYFCTRLWIAHENGKKEIIGKKRVKIERQHVNVLFAISWRILIPGDSLQLLSICFFFFSFSSGWFLNFAIAVSEPIMFLHSKCNLNYFFFVAWQTTYCWIRNYCIFLLNRFLQRIFSLNVFPFWVPVLLHVKA